MMRMEAFLLLANGELSLSAVFFQFTLPVLGGNIVNGMALFVLISYA